VFPDWNTLSAVYDANLQLAIWGVYVQGLYGEHFDHLIHLIDIPAHHVCGSIYSGVSPDILTPISNPSYSQDSLSGCLDNLSSPYATGDPVCQHCGAGGWHQLLLQHNVARCVQKALGHYLHTLHIFPGIRNTTVFYPEFLLSGHTETTVSGSKTCHQIQGEEEGSSESHTTGSYGNYGKISIKFFGTFLL